MTQARTDARLRMQDPRKAPGRAGRMEPKPDHGETSYKGSGRLPGRRALITGADSGIGRSTAIAFAREGADVAIGYLPREEEDAREVIALIEAEGRKALAIAGDARDEGFCTALVGAAVKGLGGLDILVCNAGKQISQPSIETISSQQLDDTLKTNLYALFWITRAAEPVLPPGASVINTASVQAYEPSETLLDYATTKAGIVAFTKALSKQLIKKAVRVNAVAPGPFWTALQPVGGQREETVQHFGQITPMGAQVSRLRLRPSMCSSPRRRPVSSPARSTASLAATRSPSQWLTSDWRMHCRKARSRRSERF